MTKRSLYVLILLGLYAICIFQCLHYWPLLSERVASHFGASGLPNGWSTKEMFVSIYLIAAGVCVLIFISIMYAVPATPVSSINLPNKEYWLAPERRELTLDFMLAYFFWFGGATLVLLIRVFRDVFRMNVGEIKTVQPIATIVVYVAFALFLTAMFFRRFWKIKT